MPLDHRPIRRPCRPPNRGQTLVEFALIFPIFFVLLLAVIEFAFTLNAFVSIDFATRDAALAAAEAGNAEGADCSILRALDHSLTGPTDEARVREVRIYKATSLGAPAGPVNVYDRDGTIACERPDGSIENFGYHLASSSYPEASRCNELNGCKTQPTVDTIGVQITYGYAWVTPLHTFMPMAGPGYSMVKANAMRMEPIL